MHPSSFISNETFNIIRGHSATSESLGQLHPEVLNIIYRERWFNLFVPKEYGGLALSLTDGLQIQEAIACTEGSAGWTVTLCSGANYFVGYLHPSVSKELFSNSKICFAGSGHPSGIATPTSNGYIINGKWKYATGASHATVFTAVCIANENGIEQERAFWFYRDEVVIHHDWDKMGMIATASHSFEVKDLNVPFNRTFIINPKHAMLPDPVYQYPFLQFAETTLGVNMAGMAMHFIDLSKEIFQQKGQHQSKAKDAEHNLNKVRIQFYNAISDSWNELISNNCIGQELLNNVSKISRTLSITALHQVTELYPFCGLVAATSTSPINRVWRDLHTASQHPLVNDCPR